MLNRQLMFNHVVASLIQQGKPSLTNLHGEGQSCAYRGEDGSKCALGHCIPDNRYNSVLEGKSGSHEDVRTAIDSKFGVADPRRGYIEGSPKDGMFLNEMQSQLHDEIPEGVDFRKNLEVNARHFARLYGLKVDDNLFIVPC